MIDKIQWYWENRPLKLVLLVTSLCLFVAVVFSKGFGMHDDHFLVVEASQSWVDGEDYNNWLPWNQTPGKEKPEGHSFFYVGIHFIVFSALKFLSVDDPQAKMFIIRLLHALLYLVTVIYGFKITKKLSNERDAKFVALLLGVFWFYPFLAVRQLVELTCVPFMMIGLWKVLNAEEKKNVMLQYIIAGLIMGLAFSVRFQTLIFPGGVGLVMLFQKKWLKAIVFGAGVVASIILIQGGVDYFIWGRPFAELGEYIRYNMENKYNYIGGGWYKYSLLVLGLFIPPVSLMIVFGFFRTWKKHLIVFLPTFLFFAFHSYFPNKQERFVFPVFPFIIMLGIIGWNSFVSVSEYWKKRLNTIKYAWRFFWVLNIIVLTVITTTYSKKTRVEAMYYLYKNDYKGTLLAEDSEHDGVKMLPKFYSGQWRDYVTLTNKGFSKVDGRTHQMSDSMKEKLLSNNDLEYVMFFGDKNINQRVERMNKLFGKITHKETIQPGFIDWLTHKMNPKHIRNQSLFIYKIER